MANSEVKEQLQQLIAKASEAITAIDNNEPKWKISNLAVEDIDQLTEKIFVAVLG